MQGPERWIEALPPPGAARAARLLFARLGLVAQCRPLTSGELAECLGMGGERGARYALYLACDSLREAGQRLARQGEIQTPFDITERLGYSDALAAGGLVARLSGAGPARVRQLEEGESDETALLGAAEWAASAERTGSSGQAEGALNLFASPAVGAEAAFGPAWAEAGAGSLWAAPLAPAPAPANGEGAWAKGPALWGGEAAPAGRGEAALPDVSAAALWPAGRQAEALARELADRLWEAAGNV